MAGGSNAGSRGMPDAASMDRILAQLLTSCSKIKIVRMFLLLRDICDDIVKYPTGQQRPHVCRDTFGFAQTEQSIFHRLTSLKQMRGFNDALAEIGRAHRSRPLALADRPFELFQPTVDPGEFRLIAR